MKGRKKNRDGGGKKIEGDGSLVKENGRKGCWMTGRKKRGR